MFLTKNIILFASFPSIFTPTHAACAQNMQFFSSNTIRWSSDYQRLIPWSTGYHWAHSTYLAVISLAFRPGSSIGALQNRFTQFCGFSRNLFDFFWNVFAWGLCHGRGQFTRERFSRKQFTNRWLFFFLRADLVTLVALPDGQFLFW